MVYPFLLSCSYINFNGIAEEAFTFYRSVFGGAFAKIMRFKDIAGPECPVSENEANKIMHIALPVGKNILGQMTFPKVWDGQMRTNIEVRSP